MLKTDYNDAAQKADLTTDLLMKESLTLKKEASLKTTANNISNFLADMPDIICMSHLRWDFVFQRPQHLLTRFAQHSNLYYFEEPLFYDGAEPRLDVTTREGGNINIVVAHLPNGLTPQESDAHQIKLIDQFLAERNLNRFIFWYYTPMALEITRHLQPELTVFDCMDELSAFKGAPPRLRELEAEMFKKADLVFTGGQSIYESKKNQHPEVYAFPSSIDKAHFAQGREALIEPADQANIPHPRFGFYGVVDERFDIELLRSMAALRPDWHFVIIGPVVKIDPADLPRAENIHYLGGKNYKELPVYLGGWDVALLPFARNESTKYISPTKTPEYLAAGKPVVSTSITDVIRPYGELELVHIADTPEDFVAAIEKALAQREDTAWKAKTDEFLSGISWDITWQNMVGLMQIAVNKK
ncbi:glycosyl transferase [Adhaeribacter aerolatus]|uniref:Glycosyl transferase n=1 Tax=Adhaeribacter aerolatus TaxID=670289 RepID=A0A512ARQ2_9BACT|nr:glycosyltransferase family 1 protein [Adhaeribacter aerolatus]GEO02401.1 glycosyl transferase [Adhaeribacter aerolatus]